MKRTYIIVLLVVISIHAHSATIHIPADFPTIQQGINAASKGDTVLVAPGTYVENLFFNGKEIHVISEMGPKVTKIDGGGAGSVTSFTRKEGPKTSLQGFTLTNGAGTLEAGYLHGGGIFCKESSPTILNNIICKNSALSGWGGGIACRNHSSPTIKGNLILENEARQGGGISCLASSTPVVSQNNICFNEAEFSGGGIYCFGSSYFEEIAVIEANHIHGNFASSYGGGIYGFNLMSLTPGSIRNNLIYENTTNTLGGGIFLVDVEVLIQNNFIYRNKAYSGGGLRVHTPKIRIINNTFHENEATGHGGGFCCNNYMIAHIYNTIFWNNQSPIGPEIAITAGDKYTSVHIDYSNVKGGQSQVYVNPGNFLYWGKNMMDSDPLFADPVNSDLHIQHHSPCRDGGDNTLPDLPDLDFEWDPRAEGDLPDMGADEFYTHLYHIGDASPGGSVSIKLVGAPNAAPIVLWLGSGILNTPLSLPPHGEWYLQFPIIGQMALGAIPGPGGILSLPPITVPAPLSLSLQAGIGHRLTNPLELIIK